MVRNIEYPKLTIGEKLSRKLHNIKPIEPNQDLLLLLRYLDENTPHKFHYTIRQSVPAFPIGIQLVQRGAIIDEITLRYHGDEAVPPDRKINIFYMRLSTVIQYLKVQEQKMKKTKGFDSDISLNGIGGRHLISLLDDEYSKLIDKVDICSRILSLSEDFIGDIQSESLEVKQLSESNDSDFLTADLESLINNEYLPTEKKKEATELLSRLKEKSEREHELEKKNEEIKKADLIMETIRENYLE